MKLAIDFVKESMVPIVLSNVIYEDEDIPSVAIDYESATYDITKKCLPTVGKTFICFRRFVVIRSMVKKKPVIWTR